MRFTHNEGEFPDQNVNCELDFPFCASDRDEVHAEEAESMLVRINV
jgi:hypothetical protein